MENTDRGAVVLMVTAPRAGAVKTRLGPPLGATDAAELACRFLFAMAVSVTVIFINSPSGRPSLFIDAVLSAGRTPFEHALRPVGDAPDSIGSEPWRSRLNNERMISHPGQP